MSLADYQQELVDAIYNRLVSVDYNLGIALRGDTGSGKSTIALAVAELLQEGWIVFYLRGIDPNISPYLTWHIGTKLYSKQKLLFGGELSFGINFIPAPVSFEMGGSVQREKQDFILTPSETALITSIKKQAGLNLNILFIADDYELWDVPSKQFLQKIMLPQLQLLSNYHLAVLLIGNEKTTFENIIELEDINITNISDDNVIFVLHQRGHSGPISITDIRTCAGNDLSLALMAAKYYTEGDTLTQGFDDIMTKRCAGLSLEGREACEILEPLSIIDSYFTKDEAAYFIDPTPKDKDEIEYKAEEYLTLAEENSFIHGNESYYFSNGRIRSYFKKRLSRKEKYQHRKFAQYLKIRHPEDYYNRGKHLNFSLLTNDSRIILEAWQLLFLAYIRRSAEIGHMEDVYNIRSDINLLLNRLPHDLAETQAIVMRDYLAGYEEFSKYNYKQALLYLQGITPSRLVPACLAECQRIILLCHVQLAENNSAIDQIAEELYATINSDDFFEDEQYCRAALLLIDIYLDRRTNSQKARILKQKFIQIIQRHPGNPAFEEFEACYNRKSSLYYSAIIAVRQTAQSIHYYRNHYNRNGLYMSLCNHAGNAIVSGNYALATTALGECYEMLNHSDGWYYPSKYKIENNSIILSYLQTEKDVKNSQQLILAAKKATTALSQVRDLQTDEVSHVILLNYLGLSALCGSSTWISELDEVKRHLTEIDEYYQYFLHDLNFFSALLQNRLDIAQEELAILKTLNVPLLSEYKRILYVRLCEQEHILTSPQIINGSAVEYHKIIADACSHVQDPSCRFWGRGFLLSDLQFLSF